MSKKTMMTRNVGRNGICRDASQRAQICRLKNEPRHGGDHGVPYKKMDSLSFTPDSRTQCGSLVILAHNSATHCLTQ